MTNEATTPAADESAVDTSLDTGPGDQTPESIGNEGNPQSSLAEDANNENESDSSNETVTFSSYDDFQLPDGVELDAQALESVSPLMQQAGLTQEQAQSLVTWYAEQQQAGMQAQQESFNTMVNEWAEQSKNDSEFGGEKFEENIATAKMAIDKFGTPELKDLLESHGVGNHPEVIRFMVKVGALTKEDNPGAGGNNLPAKVSQEQNQLNALYPNS